MSHAHMSSVLCDLCNDCTFENVACGRCICLHTRRLTGNSLSGKRKSTFDLRKHYCSVQDEDRQEFQLLFDFQSSCCSHRVDEDERVGFRDRFPATSKDRSSILFGHRFDNHILQVLRIVGSFAVLIVVQDEWVLFPSEVSFTSSSCSLHFSFCFNEIRSLIHWSLNTFLFNESTQNFSFRVLSCLVAL